MKHTIDNPAAAATAEEAEDRAMRLVDALDSATRLLVYHLLHADGCRVQSSYAHRFRRDWAKREA